MVRRLLLFLSRRPIPGRTRLTRRATVLDGDTIEVAGRRIRPGIYCDPHILA